MTVGPSLEAPTAPAEQDDVLAVLDELRAQVRCAEDRAVALLTTQGQRCDVTVREPAETVVSTGVL